MFLHTFPFVFSLPNSSTAEAVVVSPKPSDPLFTESICNTASAWEYNDEVDTVLSCRCINQLRGKVIIHYLCNASLQLPNIMDNTVLHQQLIQKMKMQLLTRARLLVLLVDAAHL